MFFCPGIVPALAFLINTLTNEGDGVIIQRPVYYPFTNKIEANNRIVVNNPLIREGNTYRMDYDDLDKKFADPKNKGMILCSPHNPVGRVWTKEELLKIVAVAKKYDKWIISDEIHADLTRIGITNVPLLKIAPEYKHRIIACTAPSKTFNLAGMQFSNIIIPNEEYRKNWVDLTDAKLSVSMCNPFGLEATIAAYTKGDEWLDQLRVYIDKNIDYIEKFVKSELPKATVIKCEGTYLVWIDVREYCNDKDKLEECMVKTAKLALDEGYIFGEEGIGYERINIAAPMSSIVLCMDRMKSALLSL
jgi:cystathionine beta-lyase